MAARTKKRTDTATNRESDKIIVRLPAGMRAYLADMAARHGKSMNAEVVTALAVYFAHDGEVDARTIKSELAEMKQEIKDLREILLAAYKPEITSLVDAWQKKADEAGTHLREVLERQSKKVPPE